MKVKLKTKMLLPPQLCLNQLQPRARLNCRQPHAGEKGFDNVFFIRIGILLEEERHLVGHFNWQLAQKLFINIVKTWQKHNIFLNLLSLFCIIILSKPGDAEMFFYILVSFKNQHVRRILRTHTWGGSSVLSPRSLQTTVMEQSLSTKNEN